MPRGDSCPGFDRASRPTTNSALWRIWLIWPVSCRVEVPGCAGKGAVEADAVSRRTEANLSAHKGTCAQETSQTGQRAVDPRTPCRRLQSGQSPKPTFTAPPHHANCSGLRFTKCNTLREVD